MIRYRWADEAFVSQPDADKANSMVSVTSVARIVVLSFQAMM
jgi:hypothetical protein